MLPLPSNDVPRLVSQDPDWPSPAGFPEPWPLSISGRSSSVTAGNDGNQLLQQIGEGMEGGNVRVRDGEPLGKAVVKDGEEADHGVGSIGHD